GKVPTILSDSFIIGDGSIPLSAIRPAKTDKIDGTLGFSTATTVATGRGVGIVVMFNFTPSPANRSINGTEDSPLVFVIGILTYTLSCHSWILSACRRISTKSSEKTSNEIGLDFTSFKTALAKLS